VDSGCRGKRRGLTPANRWSGSRPLGTTHSRKAGFRPRAPNLFWEYGRNTNAFAFPRGADRSPNVAAREGDWNLLVNADGSEAQLYDLKADPKESHNVVDKNPEVAVRLKEKALAWRIALPKLSPGRTE
jgi:arylsulfatase A-like enzyme